MNILIINGPNLNLLGIRQPDVYGAYTYDDLIKYINSLSLTYEFTYQIFQSNYEGAIIDTLQQALSNQVDGIIINPGAYTHYSYAIYDAILAINIPTVEVHLSNLDIREPFRQHSVIRPACRAFFQGNHFQSYEQAILFLKRYLS